MLLFQVSSNPILQALTLEPSEPCPCHHGSPSNSLILPINTNSYELPFVQNMLPNFNQNQMTPCQNPLTPYQNSVTLSQNEQPLYQDLVTPSPKELLLQNLLQNPLFTPNVNFMSNPTPCQNEMILANNQCNACQNNPLLLSRNAVDPSYANRVLANPTVETTFGPNTGFYSQYGVEVPTSPCNVPNVVNNYIIVPPEVLTEDCKKDINSKGNEKKREKDEKRKGKRRNKKNKADINVQNRNIEAKTKLIPLQESYNENKNEVQIERSTIPTNRDKILDVHGFILDKNTILNQISGIEKPFSQNQIIEINVPYSKFIDELKMPKHEPIKNQAQMLNMKIQAPENNVYNSPYTQIPISNLYNSPCLSNNYQYASTGAVNNANYNNMSDQYSQFYKNDQNSNVHVVQPFRSDNQVNVRFNDKHVNSTDINIYNIKKDNRKSIVLNNQNKPTTMVLNVPLKPQDREEFVVQSFRKNFPNIPEKLVRDLIRHMKRHLRKQNTITNQNPMFPMNFEQFYRTPFYNIPRSSKNGRRNSSKRNNRRRNEKLKKKNDYNSKTTSDITTNLNDNNTDNTATTMESSKHQESSNFTEENKIEKLENGKFINEFQPVEKVQNRFLVPNINSSLTVNKSEVLFDDKEVVGEINGNPDSKLSMKLEDTESKVQLEATNVENTQNVVIPELGKEDILHPMPMNGVDDYYSDFTVDNHPYFLTSMEDVDLESLDDRYHYTTDRNLSPKIEETTEDKVQFKTPPTLEKPDFETKKIETRKTNVENAKYKPVFTSKDINNIKVSTYSNTKTPQYNIKEKPLKNVSGKLPENRNIETVFANSKVIKYGSNHDDITSNLEDVTETNVPRNSKMEHDEDTDMKWPTIDESTIVYATSIPNVY